MCWFIGGNKSDNIIRYRVAKPIISILLRPYSSVTPTFLSILSSALGWAIQQDAWPFLCLVACHKKVIASLYDEIH